MAEQRKSTCCWCCKRGTVSLRCVLERSAYVCKECIRLKATVDNQGEDEVQIKYLPHNEIFLQSVLLIKMFLGCV